MARGQLLFFAFLSLGGRFLSLYCWACAVCFRHRAGPSFSPIHRSAWNSNSPKLDFPFTEFSEEVRNLYLRKQDCAPPFPALTLQGLGGRKNKGGAQARRFLEMLNTPLAVLVVLVVVVAVNSFLYFGYYLPRITSPAAPSISSPAPTGATDTTTPTATGSP
jgi:hypothetical protein